LSISEPQLGPQEISNARFAIISWVITGLAMAADAALGIAEWRTGVETMGFAAFGATSAGFFAGVALRAMVCSFTYLRGSYNDSMLARRPKTKVAVRHLAHQSASAKVDQQFIGPLTGTRTNASGTLIRCP
jgi:hypothetical protein